MVRYDFNDRREVELFVKMEINNKLFKTVLFTTVILVILSFSFINYLKLEEPVFFEHYYDVGLHSEIEHYEEIPFNLGYITNTGDTKMVVGVGFPEHPEIEVQASEYDMWYDFNWDSFNGGSDQNSNLGENYGRYSLRTIFCSIIRTPDTDYDDTVIRNAIIYFDDGSEMIVDIGQLNLYCYNSDLTLLEQNSSSSSSDGSSKSRYRALEDITLQSFESPLLDQLTDKVFLDINGTDISNIEDMVFEEGEYINISSRLKDKGNLIEDYTRFDIHPKLNFTGGEGNQQSVRILNINSMYHDYSFINLYRYIKERQAI